MAEEFEVEQSDERVAWVKPEMRKISAGSAEDGSGPRFDALMNPS